MFRIESFAHGSVIVADTRQALRFYQDLLGLAVNPARPDLGYPGAWLEVGDGTQIHLLELPNPDPTAERPPHGGRDRHLAFNVTGLDALAARLDAAGVAYTRSRSGRAAMFCRDPDGNTLELIETPPG
mgnify:CR=1 FL=1